MKRKILYLAVLLGMLCCGCAKTNHPLQEPKGEPLPEILQEKSFIYDELAQDEGDVLYTLRFSESGYKLYNDNGVGIIAWGSVSTEEDKTMEFQDGTESFVGSYQGSIYETPSVTITYDGKEMHFKLDSESGEYVYLSYLGTYEGEIDNKPAVLILERWFEFYLYSEEELIRGNYEICEDGTLWLQDAEGKVSQGTVTDEKAISLKDSTKDFVYCDGEATYEAEHAMGAYTLALHNAEVFTIHGADGLLKAMGTIELAEGNGNATYFPREITNEVETSENFTVEFTCQGENLIFPSATYLLPRSGNIDKETGYGSYWSAGTELEFIKNAEWNEANYIEYEANLENRTAPISTIYRSQSGILSQSMPSVGTARPLVLLVDFPDQNRPRFITAEDIEEAIFDVSNKNSLSAYYYRSSYGNLTIDGTVLDWYRMEKNRDEYDSDKEIMKEALDYYINEKGLDLSAYDADQNGVVDSLYVLWAGNMDTSEHMWSSAYRSTWRNSPEEWELAVNGYIFVPGSTVWSSVPPLKCNVNSLTHETGHLLGLNDYYSYDTEEHEDETGAFTGGALEGGYGGMDMMDANMGDHNAFSKWLLGWLEPEVVEYEEIKDLANAEKTYTLSPSNEKGDAVFVKLKSSDSLCTELLVIEVVSGTMNANEFTRLKEPVVRVTHVDASLNEEGLEGNWRAYGFKMDNSYTTTKFISILEADGKDEILNYLPDSAGRKLSYDVEDYFTAGDKITPNTYPNTDGYDSYGNATVYNGLTIMIESIAENGEAIIRLGYEEKEDELNIVKISPEPFAVPYEANEKAVIAADTNKIQITFDRKLKATEALSKIQVLKGIQQMDGYTVSVDDSRLTVTFTDKMEADTDYRLVIPANCVSGQDGTMNNYNSILGFVTNKE